MGSLIFARMVYAVNWVNVGAIWILMGPDLGSGVEGIGSVSAAFYVGIGVMQLPGGLLAAKWGPKKVVVVGIFLLSLSVLGTSFATSVAEVAALRFLVGWGMAFVFAPAVVIIAGLLRGGKSGMGVGLLNSAFDVGGVFGLFVWVLIAGYGGWRPSLELAGALGLVTGILAALFIPADASRDGFKVEVGRLVTVVRDRQLILLGLGTLGLSLGYTIISSFLIYYEKNSLGVPAGEAAVVASLLTVVPIFTAIWGGRLFDRSPRHRFIMMAALVGTAASLAFGALPSVYAAVVCSTLGGVVMGVGYTFSFAGARDLNKAGKEYESLAIAWVNSISLTGSFFPPIFFSYLVGGYGYQAAWLGAAALTLAFLVPILLTAAEWRR
jgi:MFS family permease